MFKLNSEYTPQGDQIKAIEQLVVGLNKNLRYQTLLRSNTEAVKHLLWQM